MTNHEIEWQCFKIDRPKTKLKRAFAHSRVSGTKLKAHVSKLNEEVTKMGGKTYIIKFIILKIQKVLETFDNDSENAMLYERWTLVYCNKSEDCSGCLVASLCAIGGSSSLPLRCHAMPVHADQCACARMLYISELCEDCTVANEIDYAWTSIHDNGHVYHITWVPPPPRVREPASMTTDTWSRRVTSDFYSALSISKTGILFELESPGSKEKF